MNLPRLEIYLDKQENICISTVKKQNAESRLIIDVPLDEIKVLGTEDAAYRIGGTILNILELWHKQAFRNCETAVVRPSTRNSDGFYSALRLIDQALQKRTTVHNASIEYLLKHASENDESARKYLEDAWPLLRDRLEAPYD